MVQSLQRLKAGGSSFSMMFILAMEPLHRLLELAHLVGLLSPINKTMAQFRISMYADDAAVFVNPAKEEVQTIAEILEIFGKVSGLVTNRGKCAVFPIRCENANVTEIMANFPCQVKDFPCTYKGLPLHSCIVWKSSRSLTSSQIGYQHGKGDFSIKSEGFGC